MPNSSQIEWERANISSHKEQPPRIAPGTIRLGQKDKHGRYHSMTISPDLCKAANLKDGDSIWLYKSGSLFMINKERSPYILRVTSPRSRSCSTLKLVSLDFVSELLAYKNGNQFDAWADGGKIVFKPKEVTNA